MTSDLPFAIFRYDPGSAEESEWAMRREIENLRVRVENSTKRKVHLISLATLYWKSIQESEGLEALVSLEKQRGFNEAQHQVSTYLSDPDWKPLPNLLADELKKLSPKRDIVFLTRSAVFAPAAYRVSSLLEQMKGRSQVPAVLFYPGTWKESLNYMGMRSEEQPLGSYRVKIYGRES
jgi:hypothetical protein